MTKIIKTKSMKAGYQNKPDSMRDFAHKSMKNMPIDKECTKVQKADKDCKKVQKFALGGVAKIRHEQATTQGIPRSIKRRSLSDFL